MLPDRPVSSTRRFGHIWISLASGSLTRLDVPDFVSLSGIWRRGTLKLKRRRRVTRMAFRTRVRELLKLAIENSAASEKKLRGHRRRRCGGYGSKSHSNTSRSEPSERGGGCASGACQGSGNGCREQTRTMNPYEPPETPSEPKKRSISFRAILAVSVIIALYVLTLLRALS